MRGRGAEGARGQGAARRRGNHSFPGPLGPWAPWLLLLVAACGPATRFELSAKDNDPSALAAALAARQLPAEPAPENRAHRPRAFALLGGPGRAIAAIDLAGGQVVWKVAAEPTSRIAVGGDFIVDVEHGQLVARDQERGAVRWHAELGGPLAGISADADRAYATWRDGNRWRLAAFDGASGSRLWKADADGQLGAPVARGGLVYSPFLAQWLSLIDGKTGKQLARLRGLDDQISMVRATSTEVYFGSRRGVFLLDTRSAAGTRDGATYGKVAIPPQLDRASYGRDLYDAVQTGYTAADRARVLWTAAPSDAGPMKFAGDRYAIHYFRYVFGFSSAGELVWAYSHPRVELVASDTTGKAIVALAQDGELVALDPRTGAVLLAQDLHLGAPVVGATFDADGWAPAAAEPPRPTQTMDALVAIARDRDARFDRVKELAVTWLAKLPGGEVTQQLLAVLGDARAPQRLKDTVAELLVARKDPASLPVLTAQLAVHPDYLTGTEPQALAPVARAVAGLAGVKLPEHDRDAALAALRGQLDAPTAQSADLVLVIAAMTAIGGGAEQPALASHLLLYHADDDLGGDAAWCQAIVHALHDRGGPGERELLRRVALDPRTQPELARAIHDAMGGD